MDINAAYRRCSDTVYLRSRMTHYQEIADQVRAILHAQALVVEPISIDEAFLDVSGAGHLIGTPETIGQRIKEALHAAVRLTASVGIAPNRLVAKVASDFGKPVGVVVVAPEEAPEPLSPQPVSILRGVAPRTLPNLE